MTPATLRINFPTFTTPLIGRDADVATITTRLRRSPHRFATLVGTSGTGKTRLSMQIAAAMEADFPDGMAFVPLASITDPTLVVPTIARVLGVAESRSTSFLEALSTHIGEQTMLLVLDNFEQVVEAAPEVSSLLAHVPNAQVLCTSQVPMQLTEEEVIAIPPLALPETTDSLDALEASPAVALFVERMRLVQPHFTLTKRNASAVSELCRRLHGLPLAIELVATHSERLQPDDLLLLLRAYLPQERNRRDTLTPDEVIFPVLSWCVSYGPPSIRWLLPRLGVLWGEWRMEQIDALVQDAPADLNLAATLQLMVNKGLLLSMEEQSEAPTFTMLDAIRQFAVRRLRADAGLSHAVYARHASVFADTVKAVDTGFRAGESARFGPIFKGAMPNIRAALQWFLDQGQFADALELVSYLAYPSYLQGYMREALDWIDRTAPFADAVPSDVQMRWYYAQELLALNMGAHARALEAAERGIPIARELGDSVYLLRLLNNKALMFQQQGLLAEAREIFEESLNEPSQSLLTRATTYNNLGMIAKELDSLDTSLAYHQQSLAIREELGDTIGIAMSLHNIADVYHSKDDFDQAETLYRKCLELLQHVPQSLLYIGSLLALADVLLSRDAEALPSEAQMLTRKATAMYWQTESHRELTFCFEVYANWLIRSKQFTQAAELLGASSRLRTMFNIPFTDQQLTYRNELIAKLDAALGEAARRQTQIVGEECPLADHVELVATH